MDADIALVIDSSGSINRARFDKMVDFIDGLIDELNIGEAGTHVSVVKFGSEATIEFSLLEYADSRASVKRVLKRMQYG